MQLEVKIRHAGGVAVVDLSGRLVYGDEANFARATVKGVLPDAKRVVVNIAEVAYVDSDGIGTLLALLHSAENAGCELRFAGANDRVLHVLNITRLLPILGVFNSVDEAIASFGRARAAG